MATQDIVFAKSPVNKDPFAKFKELIKRQIHRQVSKNLSDEDISNGSGHEQLPDGGKDERQLEDCLQYGQVELQRGIEELNLRPLKTIAGLAIEKTRIRKCEGNTSILRERVATREKSRNQREKKIVKITKGGICGITESDSCRSEVCSQSTSSKDHIGMSRKVMEDTSSARLDEARDKHRFLVRDQIPFRHGTSSSGTQTEQAFILEDLRYTEELDGGTRSSTPRPISPHRIRTPGDMETIHEPARHSGNQRNVVLVGGVRGHGNESVDCFKEETDNDTRLNLNITATSTDSITGVAACFATTGPSNVGRVSIDMTPEITSPVDVAKSRPGLGSSSIGGSQNLSRSISLDREYEVVSGPVEEVISHEAPILDGEEHLYHLEGIDSIGPLEESDTGNDVASQNHTTPEDADYCSPGNRNPVGVLGFQVDHENHRNFPGQMGIEELECLLQIEEHSPEIRANSSKINCLFSHIVILATLALSFFAKFAVVIFPDFSISCSALENVWSAYAGMLFGDIDRRSLVSYPHGSPPL